MPELETTRLSLHPIAADEARRIVEQRPGPNDNWAEDYPFEGDVGAVGVFLRATAEHGLTTVVADTTSDNVASQRTLMRAGFRLAGTDGELYHYRAALAG